MTPETLALRELLDARRDEFQVLLDRYGATSPKLFGSVARGTAHPGSDIDILVEMDPADGNLLMRASGLMEETRALFGRDDIDVFPVQLLKRPVSDSALADAVQRNLQTIGEAVNRLPRTSQARTRRFPGRRSEASLRSGTG